MPKPAWKLTPALKKYYDRQAGAPKWVKEIVGRDRERVARWRKPDTPFFVGQKQVYLPNFTISLLNTPHLHPTWARFKVPLNLNKLDLRDYLFHAYNVRIHSVRTYIQQHPPTTVADEDDERVILGRRKTWRPQSTKYMTVQLVEPFRWPDPPSEEEARLKWDANQYADAFQRLDSGTLIPRKGNKEIRMRGTLLGAGGDVRPSKIAGPDGSEAESLRDYETRAGLLKAGLISWRDQSDEKVEEALRRLKDGKRARFAAVDNPKLVRELESKTTSGRGFVPDAQVGSSGGAESRV